MTRIAPDTTFQSPTRLTFATNGDLLLLIEDGKQVVSIAGSRPERRRGYATPTNPATKSLAGCATTSSGVPTCSMRPPRMTTS